MTRPSWAAGPEWEGWEAPESNPFRVRKTIPFLAVDICVTQRGGVSFGNDMLMMGTPESALRIANAIAAEFGGWAS